VPATISSFFIKCSVSAGISLKMNSGAQNAINVLSGTAIVLAFRITSIRYHL